MQKNHNIQQLRALLQSYGSIFLRQIMKQMERIKKETGLTEPKQMILFASCTVFSGMTNSLFSRRPFTPFTWLTIGLFNIRGLVMTILLFNIGIGVIYIMNRYNGQYQSVYDAERNLTKSAEGTHGTAGFLEGDKIKKVYGLHPPSELRKVNGFLIGTVPDIAQNEGYIGQIVTRDEGLMKKKYLTNRNTLILGAPGTGKSAALMIPNLIESAKRGESVFVTDPKGELCDKTSPIFRELGYDVKVFNLIYPWHSDKWNLMKWLSTLGAEQEGWVGKISAMIIQNTSGPKSDTFWDNNADKLLKALMSLLLEIAVPKAKVKDKRLSAYAERLQQLRALRDESATWEERDLLNAKIEETIKEKYKYISVQVKRLQAQIDTCRSPKERERLTRLFYKLSMYRNDEALLPLLDKNNPPEDYEPLTLAEAKARILNISTCVRLLQFRISLTKEEQASMAAWHALPKAEKLNRLLYELTFKVPYEQHSYKALMQVFSLCDPNHSLAFSYYSSFIELSENICTSVKGGLDTRLSAFNQYYIRQMTSENEIDLEKPGREKCAYFCIISDQESSLSYLSSLFITIAFATLQAQADANRSRRLKIRTMFYLDEFGNIGVLYEYTKKLSTLRSRDIHILMAIQNYPQLLQRYDENLCLEMFGDCDTFLFLGCGNETKTPEFISKLMGQMTTSQKVRRRSGHILSPVKDFDYSETEQLGQRDLMYLSEVRELDQERLIVLTRGQKPMLVQKYMYFQRPDFDWIQTVNDKYPVISGSPLPGEEEIDMDKLLQDEAEAVEIISQARQRFANESDFIADEIDRQIRSMYREEQLQEAGREFRRLRKEWNGQPEEFLELVYRYFGLGQEQLPSIEQRLSLLPEPHSAQAKEQLPAERQQTKEPSDIAPGQAEESDDSTIPQQSKTPAIQKKLRQKHLNGLEKTDPGDI